MDSKPIVYIEDDEDDVFFMQRAFSEAGLVHQLMAISNGQRAMEYLSGTGEFANRERYPLPCLLLVDLNMPGKSGFEVLQWIRAQPAIATLPVLVLTSSRHDIDIHRAYQLGANAYLLKPAAPERLADMLKTIKDFWLSLNQQPPDPQTLA